MTTRLEDIDIADLSIAERVILAQSLWESVHASAAPEPFTPEQLAEIDRRLAELESGQVQGIPSEVVHARLRRL